MQEVFRPGPLGSYDTSGRVARRTFGHVLNDQHGRLVGVVVANANDLKRSARAQWDRVAGLPPGATVRKLGGSAGVPSSRSSLKVKAIQFSYPGPDGELSVSEHVNRGCCYGVAFRPF
jgi:hypothetical protein